MLLVDDNATSRRILSEILRRWGLVVEAAGDGSAALEVLDGAGLKGDLFHFVID